MIVNYRYHDYDAPFLDPYKIQKIMAIISENKTLFASFIYVVFFDSSNGSVYIERLKNNKFDLISENLEKIENEEEYLSVLTFCIENQIIKNVK